LKQFTLSRGIERKAHRIVIYGSGGVGKTSLAAQLIQVGLRPKFLDLESGSVDFNVERLTEFQTWSDIRDCLHSKTLWSDGDVPIIDTGTKAESMALAHTLTNVKNEKGMSVQNIEGYGFGKGYRHLFDTFLNLLSDLDRHYEAGRNVVIICHSDDKAKVPNPNGDDYIRYEPLLQAKGESSIRQAVKNWCDHLFFVGYDVFSEKGKATGSGTRTIYSSELPTFLAKSRTLSDPIVYTKDDATLWRILFGKED
jgi:GTPase SAR1 family protein